METTERQGLGQDPKMEVDYSASCDEKLPEFRKMAKEGKLKEALEGLIVLEKQTRTGGDMLSTGRVLVTVVQLCFEDKNWPLLNEYINMLCKRRGQLKQAVVKMIQEAITYIDKMPSRELQYELVKTLRNVTEGKIYVEVEQARLTHRYSKMKEEDGDIVAAATTMQELQVETYGSMDKREKVELILEQMRYCLANEDYIRTQIISKKINSKYFEEEATHDLKLKFYSLMVQLDQNEKNFLKICRHFRAMLDTPVIQRDEVQKKRYMRAAVLYLILSPYDNEQSDLLHRMLGERALEAIPTSKALLEIFRNQELINWKSLCNEYEKDLKDQLPGSIKTGVFDDSPLGLKRWDCFKDRVVEHNIRIMAKYYTRVTLKRMSQLLDFSPEKVEEFLCNMIVAGTVEGKIDRPSGIVSFQPTKDPSEMLNDWSRNLNTLMSLIARTTHMINKEEMVNKHLLAGTADVQASKSGIVSEAPAPMEVEN